MHQHWPPLEGSYDIHLKFKHDNGETSQHLSIIATIVSALGVKNSQSAFCPYNQLISCALCCQKKNLAKFERIVQEENANFII